MLDPIYHMTQELLANYFFGITAFVLNMWRYVHHHIKLLHYVIHKCSINFNTWYHMMKSFLSETSLMIFLVCFYLSEIQALCVPKFMKIIKSCYLLPSLCRIKS